MSDSEIRVQRPIRPELAGAVHPAEKFALLQAQTRRHFLRSFTAGVGTMFLGTLASQFASHGQRRRTHGVDGSLRLDFTRDPTSPLSVLPPQFAARAKRIIYLHMAGAPSQLELFDYKPELNKLNGQECPASFLVGKRFAFISGVPKLLGAQYPVPSGGKKRPMDVGSPATSGKAYRRPLPDQVDAHRPVQPCASSVTGTNWQSPPRLSVDRFLGDLWTGHGEPEPSRFHRAGIGRQSAGRRQTIVGLWISAQCLSGRAMPLPRRAGALPGKPSRRKPAFAPPHAGCRGRNQSANLCGVRQS